MGNEAETQGAWPSGELGLPGMSHRLSQLFSTGLKCVRYTSSTRDREIKTFKVSTYLYLFSSCKLFWNLEASPELPDVTGSAGGFWECFWHHVLLSATDNVSDSQRSVTCHALTCVPCVIQHILSYLVNYECVGRGTASFALQVWLQRLCRKH